jgi:alpha-beta hydrolase superfamily lysophospholipase
MVEVTRVDDSFVDSDGVTVYFHRWQGSNSPRAIIQIAHGLGEHAMRYDWVARQLVAAGYEVWANEHRGHGQTGLDQWDGDHSRLGRLGVGGLRSTIRSVREFHDLISREHPGVPIVFLGHSWGSLMGQILLNEGFGGHLDAVVFTGSTYRMPGFMNAGDLNAQHAHLGDTGAEWLSRDPAVHKRWVEDPLAFPANTLKLFGPLDALRLLGGPRPVGHDIPMLLMVGGDDSLGGERGVRKLENAYRTRGGLTDVTTMVYPEARHEVFHEINRDQVVTDLLSWLSEALPESRK